MISDHSDSVVNDESLKFNESRSQEKSCLRHSDSLSPANLSPIVADNNTLCPSQPQLEDALEKSREYWHRVTAAAESLHENVPRMRGRPRNMFVINLGASRSPTICLQASIDWNLNESGCDCIQNHRRDTTLLQIGTQAAVPCTLKSSGFNHWIGTADEVAVGPNYLAILALGWCYILSARLIEIQGQGAKMTYTESKATGNHESNRDAMSCIDIGEADDNTISWWSAILAPGEGWRAVIKESDGTEFLAPWSVTLVCEQSMSLKWKRKDTIGKSILTPMSSVSAFEHLAQFSLLHNLGSQFYVALTMAITVPTHDFHGTAVELPHPTQTGAQCPAVPASSIPPKWTMLYENLDYYMTLSCNPGAMISCLCGMFWEPGIPCNLVSPWLHPILNEVPKEKKILGTPERYAEILAIICGIRRPTISALWLGAVASGLTPIIIARTRRGRPPLDPVVFPWTGCPQSFMDVPGVGPYLCGPFNDEIWRADVWRLLHLPTTEGDVDELSYNYQPGTPWEPCGKMKKKDCALRVALHLNCQRHHFQYRHWNWELEDNSVIQDRGFSAPIPPTPTTRDLDPIRIRELRQIQLPLDQEASREASLDVFRWFVNNGEGFPAESIYKDEWLESLENEDSDEEDQERDNRTPTSTESEIHEKLEQWLGSIC